MAHALKFLFIGDVVGDPGIAMLQRWLPSLKQKYNADAVIVNGENSAKTGCGITPQAVERIKEIGVDVITLGNHAWDCKEVYSMLNERSDIIRPINYPSECPGKGYSLITVGTTTVAIVNLHGRAFVKDALDCPFKAIDTLLTFLKHKTNIIFVDLHAEATAEKKVIALYLDGRVSGVYGTHTHVQTSDECILPKGTSFITDLGSTSSLYSAIGMEFEGVLKKMIIHNKMGKFVVDSKPPFVLGGVSVSVDPVTGKSLSIERIKIIDER